MHPKECEEPAPKEKGTSPRLSLPQHGGFQDSYKLTTVSAGIVPGNQRCMEQAPFFHKKLAEPLVEIRHLQRREPSLEVGMVRGGFGLWVQDIKGGNRTLI